MAKVKGSDWGKGNQTMFAQVSTGLISLAQRTAERFPDHAPFKQLADKMSAMSHDEVRSKLDEYLLPVAPQLQKKNFLYFTKDPTFSSLELDKIDTVANAEAIEEIFTVLNQTLLLQSTMSLLPPNLLSVAQDMAGQLSGAIDGSGNINQEAIGAILAQAMTAAGVMKTPISKMTKETATGRLKLARKQLM